MCYRKTPRFDFLHNRWLVSAAMIFRYTESRFHNPQLRMRIDTKIQNQTARKNKEEDRKKICLLIIHQPSLPF